MRLLDAAEKAIDSAAIKNNVIDYSNNQGCVDLPKGGFGVTLQENEITVVYRALLEERCMTSS